MVKNGTAASILLVEGEGRFAEIEIPFEEVLEGLQTGTKVRVSSFMFRNMSGLLPGRMEGDEDNSARRSVEKKKQTIILMVSWLDDAGNFPTC